MDRIHFSRNARSRSHGMASTPVFRTDRAHIHPGVLGSEADTDHSTLKLFKKRRNNHPLNFP